MNDDSILLFEAVFIHIFRWAEGILTVVAGKAEMIHPHPRCLHHAGKRKIVQGIESNEFGDFFSIFILCGN